MNKWRVTIEKSPVQHKVIKVTGPETAELAEEAALTSMKWKAEDCISITTKPYEPEAPDPPTVIDVALPKPPAKPSVSELEDSAPSGPACKKARSKKK